MRFIVLAIITVLVASSIAAWAVPTAGISVSKAGEHYYWFVYTDLKGKQVTTTPRSFKDKKTTVDMPVVKDAVPKCKLFVLDAATGNEAVVAVDPAKAAKGFKFDLKSDSFDHVRRVQVLVSSVSTREPAAAAVVDLQDGDKAVQSQVLDPSANGIVEFMDVPAGTVGIKVTYGEGKSTSQDVDISLDRESAVPKLEVPVVGEIDTVKAAAADGKESGEKGEPAGTFNFATALVGLVLFVGIVYFAYVTMRKRGVAMRGVLSKVGVEISDGQIPPAAPASTSAPIDPSVCPFCGTKKDPTTGSCACTVGAGAAASPAAGSGPRLVATQGAYAGSIFALDGDTTTIGREETNAIALPQDNTSSRRHARVVKANGEFTIYDEGSSNGTFVNGVKITEQTFHPGDEIQVGSTKLRFET